MRDSRIPWLAAGGLLLLSVQAQAHGVDATYSPGSLVGVSVELDGRSARLYPAPDGSARHYLEAREGACYTVRLDNRTGERLGVALTVDGLNAISGRDTSPRWAPPGRMYVLGPWESATVRGWRTSLSEVRRFTFVEERVSYAARSGKANAKMGWIEIAVHRERRPYARRRWAPLDFWTRDRDATGAPPEPREEPAPRAAPPATLNAPAGEGRAERKGLAGPAPAQSYPGTGWGHADDDPAEVVSFDPEPNAAERIALRYEYASGLRALGIFPRPYWGRDRLRERDRALSGFAPPPAW